MSASAADHGQTAKPKQPQLQQLAALNTTSTLFTTLHSYGHIAVIVVNTIWRFPDLVATPVTTLLSTLLPLAVLQGVYLISCVPLVNSSGADAGSTSTSSTSSAKSKRKQQQQDNSNWAFKIVPTLISLILTISLATPTLYIALLLFGAPLATHTAHTLLCAAHMALLSAPALFLAHGVRAEAWVRIAALDAPVDGVYGAALGTLLGAWVGAVPIPLDWDREWQKWPVTIVAGAYAGWALGTLVGLTVGWGRRIRL